MDWENIICKTCYLTSIKDKNSNDFIIKRQTTQFKNGQKYFGQKYCGFKKFSESDLRGTD